MSSTAACSQEHQTMLLSFPCNYSAKILQAFLQPAEGWVMVLPKETLSAEPRICCGVGAVGYDGNGRWKFDVSIHPEQLQRAIPIIVEVLLAEDAPRLGFKIQTRANLDRAHQIGKELAIIFDEKAEVDAQQGGTAVQRCLRLLWTKLHFDGICAESGLVLTAQTMDAVRASPIGSQIFEKKNLEAGKFDRAISCPDGVPMIFYRDENCVIVDDDLWEDMRDCAGVAKISDVVNLARMRPEFAHNPTKALDPFLHFQI